jgi:hypothetical protein
LATISPSASFSSSVTATNNPQVARYVLTAPAGSSARVEFGLTTEYGRSTWEVPAPAGGGLITILVAGMLAGSTYHMRAVVRLENGTLIADVDHTFTAGELPLIGLPKLAVTTVGQPCPGVEFVNMNPGLVSVADLQGNIIWYYRNESDIAKHAHPMPMKPLSNGNMMALITNRYTGHPTPYSALREFDLAGDTVSNQYGLRQLEIPELNERLKNIRTPFGRLVQVNYYSHDFLPLPNGHVIALCQEFLTIEGIDGEVWGDALVDLDESFTPVWVWSAFDVLSLDRKGFEWVKGGAATGSHDWTHCNCVDATPDGNLLLSVRNQSWVLKLDYANGTGDGSIMWTLGFQGDFALQTGPADWFYAQHYPHILETSGPYISALTVVDNGNCRVASDPPPYSRGLIMNIDEAQKTAEVIWRYTTPPSFYSFWGGDVVRLPNGHMEVCMSDPYPDRKPMQSFAREVTYDQQPVWTLDVTPANAYRSYRIPSLYPGVQW